MRKSLFYEYYGGHLGCLHNTTCYTCKKKWNPIFFSSRSYSEPESVAKSILTNKKTKLQMDLHYIWFDNFRKVVECSTAAADFLKII